MDRREFIRQGAAASLLLGTGFGSIGCARNLREEIVGPDVAASDKGNTPAPWGWEVLFYASLAPSGHNSQPWFVRVEAEDVWVVGSDPRRWLPAVDPDNREVLLSIGAFLENLVQAAAVKGFDAEVEVLTEKRYDKDVARVRFRKGRAVDMPLARLTTRRTLKTGLLSRELRAADIRRMESLAGGGLYYFPMASEHGGLMAEAALENFRIQFQNESAMAEAVTWTRLSEEDARRFRDGLTPESMEIHGLAGWWVRHFMDVAEVSGKTWRKGAVDKVAGQVREGAGWLVITSPGRGVSDLIDTGRRFQRMALMAREMGIALHPMTQTLEESHGKRQISENHNPGMIPQFMLRVGYVDDYPDPVSLRRPVSWFIT